MHVFVGKFKLPNLARILIKQVAHFFLGEVHFLLLGLEVEHIEPKIHEELAQKLKISADFSKFRAHLASYSHCKLRHVHVESVK